MLDTDAQQRWSQRKTQLIVEYVPRLCATLSPSTPLWVVDGWAGAPHYGTGRWREPGAPLQVSADLAQLGQQLGRDIRCLFVEADANQAAALQAALAARGDQALVWHGDWTTHVLAVLKQLGAGAALVMLDGGTIWPIAANLAHLARRLPRTEVLVRYQRSAVTELLAAQTMASQPQSRHLDQVFGSRRWRTVVEGASDVEERDRQLRDLYAQMLVDLGGGRFRWAAACPVHTSWGALAYDLVFATPARAAGMAMNEVLYHAEGQHDEDPEAHLRQQTSGRPKQIGLFDAAPPSADQLRQHKIAAVVEHLRMICDTQPRLWNYADLFDQLLRGGWFGQLAPSHVQAACRILASAGRLQRVSKGTTWDEKTLVRLLPNA